MIFNTFISFSYTDHNVKLKNKIAFDLSNNELTFDYSEKEDRSEFSDECIWEHLEHKIKRCSITILLYTDDLLYENSWKLQHANSFNESGWIYKELSCTLRDWENNRINGLLVVDCTHNRNLKNSIYQDNKTILSCNINNIKSRRISDCMIDSLKYNMRDSYIVICTIEEFYTSPKNWLSQAFLNRYNQINFQAFNISYDLHNWFKRW